MNENLFNHNELSSVENVLETLENNEQVENLNPNEEDLKTSNEAVIETLDDNFNGFTPIVSDGIIEEVLDINEPNLELLEDNDNTIIDDNILEEPQNILAPNDNLNNQDFDELKVANEELDDSMEEKVNNLIDSETECVTDNVNNETTDFRNLDQISEETISLENNSSQKEIDSISTNDDINNKDEDLAKKDNELENSDSVNNETNNNLSLEDGVVNNNTLHNEANKLESDKSDSSLLEKYGENFSIKEYVCNPAIGRDNEIKQLILTLLTPEKSGILVGKPGIGKTAIVEGLGYQIQKGNVPDALKDYQIYKLNTSSLLGLMPGTNEPKIQVLLNEVRGHKKLILFIDEIHTLIGTGSEGDSSLDFANIFKPGLDRGNIKIIGATTSDEYDRYILTDKAFVRRFQKIDVLEPTKEHTVKILMGSLPKLEHKTGVKLKYTPFVQEKIMTFIVDLTTEYRRVYELSARYPDVALTILQQSFSYAVFDNKKEVGIRDVRKAIYNTKLVYPDVIKKELIRFNDVFSDIYLMETPQRLKGETSI